MKKKGQTMIEVIVIISVVIIIMTALISTSTSTLNTALFNTRKSQATKFAQEGIELSRQERDKSWFTFYTYAQQDSSWCVGKDTTDITSWEKTISTCSVNIDGVFTRTVALSVVGSNVDALVTVTWRQGNQIHTSKVETLFTQWQ